MMRNAVRDLDAAARARLPSSRRPSLSSRWSSTSQAGGRVAVPDARVFDRAGRVLQRILVNDVLIALSARSIGATVVSADTDFKIIETVVDFKLELIR